MLSQIPWNEFFLFLFIVLGLYYGIIVVKYWRKEMLAVINRLTGKKTASPGIDARSIKEKK